MLRDDLHACSLWTEAAGVAVTAAGLNTKLFCVQRPIYVGQPLIPQPSATLDGSVCNNPDQLAFWDPVRQSFPLAR